MTTTTPLDHTAGGENQAIIDITRQASQPIALELGKYWLVNSPEGIEHIDLTRDSYRDFPARITQTVDLSHVDSLLAYWDKHADASSDAYADREQRSITAVLDAHHASEDSTSHVGAEEEEFRARWQGHRAVLILALSDPAVAWLRLDGQLVTQERFAEFLEDQLGYIAAPPAADLLEMVQEFHATTTASFKSGYRIRDGQRQLEYTEQIDATVKGDSIAVPQTITLRLPIWRGATTAEELTARIRYRINHGGPGKLGIGYKIDRPTETLDAAFEAEVTRVETHIGRSVLRGTPAG